MGFTVDAIPPAGRLPPVARPRRAGGPARVFAIPAGRLTAAVALGVLTVALIAGAVRLLPLLLAPGVPLGLATVLARGAVAAALEAALFVAPPLGWALAASRLVDRGEARALFAVGVSPWRLLAGAWPIALAVLAAASLASAVWGREAVAPGRAVGELLAGARAACVRAAPPAATEVPLLGISWICLAGEPPRAVGVGQGGRGAFAAAAIEVSDDLTALQATDLTVILPAEASGGEARLHAATASIRGLSPIGRASNLSVPARMAVLSLGAAALAAGAAALVLLGAVRNRVAAGAIGASGPGAALLVFSALERGPAPLLAYAAVPAAGLLALVAAAALARLAGARAP